MTYSELQQIHMVPEIPIFTTPDLCSLLDCNKVTLSRIRKKGWLLSVPGYSKVSVPRCEVFRYMAGACPAEFQRIINKED